MKVIFWLDPKIDFDTSTPEFLSNIADGLSEMNYDVELLIEDQSLDDYQTDFAAKRVWFAKGNQQIVTDILICNCLEKLSRTDLYIAGELIWLALDKNADFAIEKFENCSLHEQIKIVTPNKEIKEKLTKPGVDIVWIKPGIRVKRFNNKIPTRKGWGVTACIFDPRPETTALVLQGIEMTRSALRQIDVMLISDREIKLKSGVSLLVKPTLEKRIQCYEQSNILIYIPYNQQISLIPLEAMAIDLPVILLNHSSIKEYANDDQNCLVLDQLNPKGVAQSILKILKLGQIRERLKSCGQKTAQEYDLEASLLKLQKLFSKMLPLDIITNDEIRGKNSFRKESLGVKTVDIVLVNNHKENEIKEVLEAIFENTDFQKISIRILVIDNQGDEITHNYLAQENRIDFLYNQSLKDSVAAYNQGILVGKSHYILIMHSNIKVTQGWLTSLLEGLKKSDVGMVVAKVHSDFDDENSVEVKKISKNLEILLDFEAGCVLIERPLVNKIGLFDEKCTISEYIDDYCLRLQEKGYKTSVCAEATVLKKFRDKSNFSQNVKDYFQSKWQAVSENGMKKRKVDGFVFLPLYPWERKGQWTETIINHLIRQNQKILYVQPYCSDLSSEANGENQYTYTFKGSGTIYQNFLSLGRRVEMTHELKAQLKASGITAPLLWIENPEWEPLVKHIEHIFLIYTSPESVVGDDLGFYQQLRARFIDQENSLIEAADLILTSSKSRKKELESYLSKLLCYPGGFFPTDLDRFLKGYYTVPEELIPLQGIKIGIIGTLHQESQRELLGEIARETTKKITQKIDQKSFSKYRDVSFIFLGEITCNLGELKEISNLYFLGNKEWESLLDYIYYCDIILYPFPDYGFNIYLNPFMINYYLAMGKPVIAFEHRELDRFVEIKKAENEDEFKKLVEQTIYNLDAERSEVNIQKRINEVKGNGWDKIAFKLYKEINERVPIKIVSVPIQTEETKPEKENLFTNIFKQLFYSYQRLFSNKHQDVDQ